MGVEKRGFSIALLLLAWLLCGGCGKDDVLENGDKAVAIEVVTPQPTAKSSESTTKPSEPTTASPEPTAVATASPKPVATFMPPKKTTATTTASPAPTIVPATAPVVHVHEVVQEEKVPTCLEHGVQRSYCITCGETFGQEEKTEPLGHSFEKAVWEIPTCQKGGYYNNICSRCGLVECMSQDALAHEVEDIVLQEGNCMEDTIIQHKCKKCGVQVKEDTRYTNYELHCWKTALVEDMEITYCEWCGVSS